MAERAAASASAAPATPSSTHASGAPRASHRDEWELSRFAITLGAFVRAPEKATAGVDETGRKTITWRLPDTGDGVLVELTRYRDEPRAWRLEISGKRCADVGELGLDVSQLGENAAKAAPHFSGWYQVSGGPLDGTLARVFNQGVDQPERCSFLPGTREYWARAGYVPGQ